MVRLFTDDLAQKTVCFVAFLVLLDLQDFSAQPAQCKIEADINSFVAVNFLSDVIVSNEPVGRLGVLFLINEGFYEGHIRSFVAAQVP